jgi:uncharacterized protein YeaO (DUF488 family)
MPVIKIKRVYESAEKTDGLRILVDRLWPRGMKKETAHIDLWMKEIAPSTELRKWFHQHIEKWTEFCKLYSEELKKTDALAKITEKIKEQKTVTFLYASHDEEHNHALVLQKLLKN